MNEIINLFFQNLSELVPDTSIDKVVIGSNNGMAPNKRQPITWTNDDKFYDTIWPHWVNCNIHVILLTYLKM